MFAQKPDLKLVCAKRLTDNKVIGTVIAEYGSTLSQHSGFANDHLAARGRAGARQAGGQGPRPTCGCSRSRSCLTIRDGVASFCGKPEDRLSSIPQSSPERIARCLYVTLCTFPRTSRIAFLARLRARQRPAFEFAFRLEPIVQFAARLFAAFKIDFVCAKFDFLLTRRVPRQSILRPRRRGGGCLGPYTFVPLCFR